MTSFKIKKHSKAIENWQRKKFIELQKKNKQFEKDFWKPFTVISRKELRGKNDY
jgi:hypothetical protein